MVDREHELIEVVGSGATDPALRSGLWEPIVGPEAESVIEQVASSERPTLRHESCEVLSNCLPPTGPQGHRTGLVIGHIQSGKTLSFTTISALAHDNGFRLIIVIAGTSTNLLHQSTNRLQEDLNAEGFWGRWRIYRSDDPEIRNGDAERIRAHLQRWEDSDIEEDERQTVLITVMKERTHLDKVIRILLQLDLANVPALVVDDEADQASLNIAVRSGEESSIYRRMLQLRSLVPRHTFLQYTATPQALLLINLIDRLSPDFGQVLTPGEAYTGGRTFFRDYLDLVRRIPPADVPTRSQPIMAPPDSLLEAMQLFFIGVAVGIINRYQDTRNRSMMIHPTYRTDPHTMYAHWVRSIQGRWERTLELEASDPDRQEFLTEFRAAYDDLSSTVDQLPAFEDVIRRLPRALRETHVEEVNASRGQTPQINWSRNYAWILVGGQALDRGFTVEGLTVTYMPRGLGVGNADTIQQRARWFGYKTEYLGYCRVFLPDNVIGAYRDYVDHEEDVRRRLQEHLRTGRPLKAWRRAFILSGALSPTRREVLGHDITRGNYRDRWFSPRSPHASEDTVEENRTLVRDFINAVRWALHSDDPRLREHHRHRVARNLPLREVYEHLLVDFTYASPRDSLYYTGVLLQIGSYLAEHPHAACTIYLMRPGQTSARGADDEGEEISQLFQGAYPVEGEPKIYSGDRQVRADEELTIQIHHLDVYQGPVHAGQRLAADVPVLAIWVPADLSAPWVIQDQDEPD